VTSIVEPSNGASVLHLRQHLLRHRLLAAWLIAAALLMKVLVPTGYMVSATPGAIAIELCSGYGPVLVAPPTTDGMGHRHHHPKSGKETKEPPCAFSALSAPSLSGGDPILLLAAIPFIVLIALRLPEPGVARASDFLRPPLRGPPIPA
jgi:hypothetical protein